MSTFFQWVALSLAGVVLSAATPARAPDVEKYDSVLKRYVTEDGRVRYTDLKKDFGELDRFVQQLGEVSPDSHPALFPSREHRLAYWLNAYNALVLWGFTQEYPEKKFRLMSLLGRSNFFYLQKFRVGGQDRSLDGIETVSIRKAFGDSRIHFVLVCASTSCPWLSRDAFAASHLDRQLEARTKLFLAQERNVQVDRAAGVIRLSKLFDWYAQDFGGAGEVLKFIARYRPADSLGQGRWRIRFFRYDWGPNDASRNAPDKFSCIRARFRVKTYRDRFRGLESGASSRVGKGP